MSRRSKAPPLLPSAPEAPTRQIIAPAPDEPVWCVPPPWIDRPEWVAFTANKYHVDTMVRDWLGPGFGQTSTYVLPPYQRGWSGQWDAERCCAYLNALWRTEEQPPLVLWRTDNTRTYLLDGQHRLATLGACVIDAHGTPRTSPQVSFDLIKGLWVPGDGDDRTVFSRARLMQLQDYVWENRTLVPWQSDAFVCAICRVVAHIRECQLPVLMMSHRETPEAWTKAFAYFVHMHMSIPFNAQEMDAMRAYVESLEAQ